MAIVAVVVRDVVDSAAVSTVVDSVVVSNVVCCAVVFSAIVVRSVVVSSRTVVSMVIVVGVLVVSFADDVAVEVYSVLAVSEKLALLSILVDLIEILLKVDTLLVSSTTVGTPNVWCLAIESPSFSIVE